MTENIKCNLCGSSRNKEVYKDDKTRYVMCGDCSLMYLNPRLDTEEYEKFYSDDYQKHRHKIITYEQAVKKRESKGDAAKIKRAEDFTGYIGEGLRVLDIGCGWGTLLNVVKNKFGCEVTGIEISKLASEVAQKYYGLNVYNQTFESYVRLHKGEKFDFIILTQVLEHFTEPLGILSKISKLLNDNGYVYITVPNTMNPDESLDRFFHFEHCYYFTPLTLKKMLLQNGFKIIWMSMLPREIKIIAAKTNNLKQEIDSGKFELLYSPERVLSAIKKQDKKYKVLRFFKNMFEKIFPEKLQAGFKKISIKIFKKIKIIEV